jgi:fibronectin type 3 domain-containing protein
MPPHRDRALTGVVAAVVLAVLLIPLSSALSSPGGGPAPAPPGADTHQGPNGEVDVNLCAEQAQPGSATCFARGRVDSAAEAATPAPAPPKGRKGSAGPTSGSATGSSPTPVSGSSGASPDTFVGDNGAYSPAYLQSAYNAPSANAGATVAIVDAYDDPSAATDLAYYRSYFGLPPCTADSGCFRKVDQRGGTSYPQADQVWGSEISLDLDMVSAICPNCQVLLVEADSNSIADLGAAVNEAVALGASVVSNSWGGSEYSGEQTDNARYFDHPGIPVVFSSGDSGYGAQFPAASPDVVAVGGTSLYQATADGTRNATESAWLGSGSGCSRFMPKPTWQHDTHCSYRSIADVSAVADPSTGVWVWDSYPSGGWGILGGTSVAAPIISALYALAGNTPGSSTEMASTLYGDPGDLNDVTSGVQGGCGTYLCGAGPGYDGPTGLGTPNAITPFLLSSAPQPSVPAPTSLTAAFGHSIDLSWSAPAGVTVSQYLVYRDGAQIDTTTNTYYYDDGVSAGGTYSYDVRAVDSSGNVSAPSNVAVASVPTAPTPPGAPALSSVTPGNKSATLSWATPPSNGSAITGYRIYRGTASGAEKLLKSVALVTSFADTQVSNGTTYYYEVSAVNSVGAGPVSAEGSATPATRPSAPGGLGASANAAAGVVLTWSAPSNGGSPITGYNVYRSTKSGAEVLLVSLGNATSYTDTAVANGTTYYYKVGAVNAMGASSLSTEKSAKRGTPSTAPRNLVASASSTLGVTLKWSTPASNGGANVTGYRIYRASASGAETLVATVGNVTSFTDTSAGEGGYFYYEVTAVNSLGESVFSNEAGATAR